MTKVYVRCATCRPKHAKTANTSANRAEVVRRHKKTDKGKASNAKYKKGDTRKASNAKYAKGDAGKATNARYAKGDKRKASNAKYTKGTAGKATRKRTLAMRKARRAADPAYSKRETTAVAAAALISGKQRTSELLIERTEFVSEESFLAHMASEAAKLGFSLKDHGSRWEVEHKIPQDAYDFDNPVDVKRCWSYSNLHAMPPKDNKEKSFKILDELVREVDSDFWPLRWKGKMPTPAEKEAFYAKVKAEWGKYKLTEDDEEDGEDDEDDSDNKGEEAGPSGASNVAGLFDTDSDSD